MVDRLSVKIAVLAVLAGSRGIPVLSVAADTAFHRDFNSPKTTWQLLDSGVAVEIRAQECVPHGARDNLGSERIVVAAPAGQSAMLACPTARMAVLDELEIRVWVKAGRPDVQLAARVMLPRVRDSQGRATTVIVRGPTYTRAEKWQQLTLANVPKRLAAQIRVMRAVPGATIDPREAFIDAVVLVVPGEPGGVETFTDELHVDGVLLGGDDIQLASFPGSAAATAPSELRGGPGLANSGSSAMNSQRIRLQGGVLLVEDKPFLPRVIRWHGEALSFLGERGFNVVQMEAPPTDEQIAEATQHKMWFICSPPRPEQLARDGLGQPGDRVLAWFLPDDATETDPQYARRWVELIRERDAVAGRPVLIAPETDWAAASDTADVLVAQHPRFGRLSEADYEKWLDSRPLLTKPGTPLWAHVATQFGEAVRQQLALLTGEPLGPLPVDTEQLELLVRIACTRGMRAFVFDGESPLSESDAATQHRAKVLELINRRLQLIEPWLAGGKVVGRVESSDPAWSGVVLHVDRARLVMPVAALAAPHADAGPNSTPAIRHSETVFVVPGIPESSQAFILSHVALRALPTQRVAGGTRLALRSLENELVLITEDPQVVQNLRQRIARDGGQFVRLQRDLAAQRATLIAQTAHRLTQLGYSANSAERAVASANAQLVQSDALLASGQIEQACRIVEASNRALAQEADEQRRGVATATAFHSNPLALSYERLADGVALERSLEAARGSENMLDGGDFEDLAEMTRFGWQHFRHRQPGVECRVVLSAANTKHGGHCLELHAGAASPGGALTSTTGAPVWVVSPPMQVDKGLAIEITGWVRIDEPIVGSGESLQIVDSLGGPELSLALRETSGWQPFRMIRAAAETGELRLTFALAGQGTACVDAVMVRSLSEPIARRLPPTTSPQSR